MARWLLPMLGLAIVCGCGVPVQEIPPTELAQLTGSWNGPEMSLTIGADGKCDCRTTTNNADGTSTDVLFDTSLQKQGAGHVLPLAFGTEPSSDWIVSLDASGKALTLTQSGGTRVIQLARQADSP